MNDLNAVLKNAMYQANQDDVRRTQTLQRINHEKELIQSIKMLDGKLNIHESLQLFLSYAHEKKIIESWDEQDLVKQLIYALIKIRDEARKNKSPIKIELGPFEVIDHLEFLEELKKIDFRKFSTLAEWYQFISHFSDYSIHSRNIRTLMIRLGFEHQHFATPNTNKQRVVLAKQKIIQVLTQLSEEEKSIVLSASQGQSGLKALVKSKISKKEMHELFPNTYDFNNRWNETKKTYSFKSTNS